MKFSKVAYSKYLAVIADYIKLTDHKAFFGLSSSKPL